MCKAPGLARGAVPTLPGRNERNIKIAIRIVGVPLEIQNKKVPLSSFSVS
jgi:transcription antitermination factor NusA-like protein